MKTSIAAIASLLLVGCSSSPDCGSSDSEKLIVKLVNENNLLGKIYQGMFIMKNSQANLEVDKSKATELNKLNAELTSAKFELDNQVKQCISTSENLPVVTSASNEIQQLKIKIGQANSSPPNLERVSDAELMKMSSQQSTQYRRDQEMKYMNNKSIWSKNIDAMNRDLEKKTSDYNESLKFISFACSLDTQNSVNLRPYPELGTKVNLFVNQTIDPIQAKVLKISSDVSDITKKSNLIKEEKEAKEIEIANKNIENAKLKLDDVITMSKDKNTEAVSCRAALKFDVKDLGSSSVTIYYNLEKTSKGDLYGTISKISD